MMGGGGEVGVQRERGVRLSFKAEGRKSERRQESPAD